MGGKRKKWPEHRMGVRTGYEVWPDGSIKLAPMWTDRMENLNARELGLREMQQTVIDYVADQFTRIAKERGRWWDDVFADLGMIRGSGERWQYVSGILRKMEPEPDAQPSPEEKHNAPR